MKRVPILAVVVALCAAPATGQQPEKPAQPATAQKPAAKAGGSAGEQPTTREQIIEEMVGLGALAATSGVAAPFASALGGGGRGLVLTYLVAARNADKPAYKNLLALMETRQDTQVGSPSASSGSTSLAMKGLVPKVLGVAAENGALGSEVKGTTVTFRATPAGIVKALQGRGILDMYRDYSSSAASRFAARFSVAAGFDTSRAAPADGSTGAEQLSSWSARVVVVNGRDPAARQYADRWHAVQKSSQPYLEAAGKIDAALNSWPEFAGWEKQLKDKVKAEVDEPYTAGKDITKAEKRFKELLAEALPKLEKIQPPQPVVAALDTYVNELTSVQKRINDIYAVAGKGMLLTADWTTARDPKLPDLYTATVVWESGLGKSRKTDLTLNGAFSFFETKPEGAGQRFKSFDLAVQLEHPIAGMPMLPTATLSIAGRYSHVPKDTVASTGTSTTTPNSASPATGAGFGPVKSGDIWVVQGKLTVPIKGSGLKIPLSVTWSNRTELNTEKDVRASFGVTFDLDTLLAAASAKQ